MKFRLKMNQYRLLISLLTVIQYKFSYAEDNFLCNDTSLDLKITATISEITTDFTKNVDMTAEVNYPTDQVTVKYWVPLALLPYSMFPSLDENCVYEATILASNYDTFGININVSLTAESDIRDQTAMDFISVIVRVPPSISSSSEIEIKENEVYTLNCSATGNPSPTLRWNLTDKGNNVKQDGTFQTIPQYKTDISSTTRLTVGSEYGARYNDSGGYECIANNTVGKESKVVLQLSVHIPVEYFNSSGEIKIIEGSPIDISCDFRGFPTPNITWRNTSYEATEVVYDDIYTSSTLHIPSSKCDDERQFTCYATNTIVEDGMVNASGNVIITLQDPTEVQNLKASSDECNGTFMLISWDPIDNWITDLTYQIQYNSSYGSNMTETKNLTKIINTQPNTTYNINVFAVSECNKTSTTTSVEVHTGIDLPSEPLNVTATENASVCLVKWSEPVTTYNNLSQYIIYYQACNRASGCNVDDNSIVTCDSLSCEINMVEINSRYYIEVSAENCAGAGTKANASGECSTDTTATSHITPINPETIVDSEENENGIVIVHFEGFEVNIPEQSQENGDISCYYVVMVRYGNLYNASDQVQNRTIIDPNNLASIADADVKDIKDGQPYFSVASTSFGNVPIGDENVSTCDISRSIENKYYAALNRNLTADRSYDMFILTTVPSVKDPTKMYSQSSNATFINVVESFPKDPKVEDDFPVAAVVVPIVLVVLIAAAAGSYYWYYRNKKRKIAKDSSISFHREDVSPYEQTNISKNSVSPTPSEDKRTT